MMSLYATYCWNKWCIVGNKKTEKPFSVCFVMINCMTSGKIWALLAGTYI
jgi:hypothetical protein